MRNLSIFIGILVCIIVVKLFVKDEEHSFQELSFPESGISKLQDRSCIPIDKFLAEYPDATSEEFSQVEECNRERAVRLGLDKPNTSFLGNTHVRPDGALAHYDISGGRSFFTVFEDHVLINETGGSTGDTKISFSDIETIELAWDMPSTININYQNEHGTLMQFSFLLLRDDDMVKAEGARDLDRLVVLLERQRNKYK